MKHILIAEDDSIQRRILIQALRNVGDQITVHEAADGHEAVEMMKARKFDLVITDINMPRAKGFIVIAYLNAFMPNVPCIVMTAFGTSRLKAKMPHDLLKFYHKPFDAADMTRAVLDALHIEPGGDEPAGITLIQFLDIVSSQKETCTITVSAMGQPECRIYLERGELMDAQLVNLFGEEALVEALKWPSVVYRIENGVPDTLEKHIRISIGELVDRLGA